ncbi:7814_t:CDS:2 [Cetraspora pellucida]|uniref:Mitochondrial import inner membrane translocase subunit n=1 Tax=Cetraspora pellucida TaxID=1433469 RepID=A0A9N9CQ85_9GLOM|nr:7814_t:CDS:2 [Cetraspora pellucida]
MSSYSSDFNMPTESQENRKQAVMDQVRNELALVNAQELINKINEKCFSKCITKPGYKLESSEQTCIAKCMDRYMDAWNIVSRAYISRVQRESSLQGGSL